MKYEVIGWTHCGNPRYPLHEDITACVDNAIINEIRKYGYLFGGDGHENHCPVLNDGTYVSYSWRGWGRIMAKAYGIGGERAYMYAYMDLCLDPKALKYPENSIDDTRIVPKEKLAETFVMHLNDHMLKAVENGTKNVEIRLFDDKRQLVDIGDYIEFRSLNHEEASVKMRVKDLILEPSFKKTFEVTVNNGNGWVTELRFSPKQLGMPDNYDSDALVKEMYNYYDKAKEEAYGVIAFILAPCRSESK